MRQEQLKSAAAPPRDRQSGRSMLLLVVMSIIMVRYLGLALSNARQIRARPKDSTAGATVVATGALNIGGMNEADVAPGAVTEGPLTPSSRRAESKS